MLMQCDPWQSACARYVRLIISFPWVSETFQISPFSTLGQGSEKNDWSCPLLHLKSFWKGFFWLFRNSLYKVTYWWGFYLRNTLLGGFVAVWTLLSNVQKPRRQPARHKDHHVHIFDQNITQRATEFLSSVCQYGWETRKKSL